MLVSNLQVILWPIPIGGVDLNYDMYIYNLQITNLEKMKITFDIECRIGKVFVYVKDTKRAEKALLDDIVYGPWYKTSDGYFTSNLVDIPAHSSTTWYLSPLPSPKRPYAQLYVTGYVSLRVPVWRSDISTEEVVPQFDEPVRVLLSAWQECRRHQMDKPMLDNPASSERGVQLASGKAYNEISPDTSPYVDPKFRASLVKDSSMSWREPQFPYMPPRSAHPSITKTDIPALSQEYRKDVRRSPSDKPRRPAKRPR